MTKIGLLGAAASVLSSVLAGPAMAQRVISYPSHYAHNAYCQNKEPGNPYSERYDYQAWTAWRAGGGWDSRGDWDCWYNSRLHYRGEGPRTPLH